MVLCLSPDDRPALEALYRRGLTNGVEGLSLLTGEEARALEPHLTQAVEGALLASSGGIVCPFELTAALAENARANGAERPLPHQGQPGGGGGRVGPVRDVLRRGAHQQVAVDRGGDQHPLAVPPRQLEAGPSPGPPSCRTGSGRPSSGRTPGMGMLSAGASRVSWSASPIVPVKSLEPGRFLHTSSGEMPSSRARISSARGVRPGHWPVRGGSDRQCPGGGPAARF